ncbi:MAG: PSD1 and planctomycete cytochrome C domain-containing protein [Verrucomicrobiia bacterium]
MRAIITILFLGTTLAQAGAPVLFEKDIRPILKAHCFQCHGEDGKEKGDLDVRLRRLLLEGGEHGAAIVVGQPRKSRLYQFVRDGKMPKGQANLSAHDLALIRDWIAQGAKTARPEPEDPDAALITEEERNFWAFQPIKNPTVPKGAKHPIDAFLLRALKAKGLDFSKSADKRTLIRRATFDLIGLPPSRAEIKKFIEDKSPDAYAKLIDRLLASPRYGERWGRHWLDVAGYADSEGYTESDAERAWAWRYRDYVIRAFNDDLPWDRFIREQLAGDEMVKPPYKNLKPEQINQLTATGFLRMAPDGTGNANNAAARNQVMAETLKIVSTSLMGLTVGCAQCHDHRYDPIPQRDYYQLRAIFEPGLDPKRWRVPNSRRITLFTDADRKKSDLIEVEAKKLDTERQKKIEFFIERTLAWKLESISEATREPLSAAYRSKKRTDTQNALLKKYPSVRQISAGSLYLYDREYSGEISKLNNERKKFAAKNDDPNSTMELKRIDVRIKFFRDALSKKVLDAMAKKAADLRATKPHEPFIRALTEQPGTVPITHIFYRGNHDQPKAAVKPAGLTVIFNKPIPENNTALPSTGRRLAFANRLTDDKHPLTARVLVNRFWLHHFGRGIVDTPGDFGKLGERPSHPELLDWLASDFMKHGWQLKRMHKLIMTSHAYRQASRRNTKLNEIDPDNRLLARMNPRRMEAETLRDALLALSGRLNLKMHGPPVPVMENEDGQIVIGVDTTDNANRPTGKRVNLKGEEFRRSLYVQVRRSQKLSFLDAFDAPTMEPNCTKRPVSTVAPQALIFMNNNFVINQSRMMAERLQKLTPQNPDAQLAVAWEHALGHKPTAAELSRARAFVQKQTALFNERKDKTPKLTALANYCQALMSANRFVYVD